MKFVKIVSKIIFVIIIIVSIAYCKQEKIIFMPDVLPGDYHFTFESKFHEYFIKVDNKTTLNGLLFKADSSKGLVFYLHGNAGAINSWGSIAEVYLKNKYDFFILDYRGYGKSQGHISSERQLYNDIQIIYDTIKKNLHRK